MTDKSLFFELEKYSKSGTYPFHMPGHKRKVLDRNLPYEIDITEIGGFDNLAAPSGLIKHIEDRLAGLYKCSKAKLLVNGSTCGNLAMLYAALKPGDHILAARNCHKSVYHGIEIRNLKTTFIMPETDRYGIPQAIEPEMVRDALDKNPDIKAFILTSPTYEGIVSDIRKIAEICHDRRVSLLVDAAHGAHLGLEDSFPENPINLGADLVTVSLHKTLPMFTMSAALLVSERGMELFSQVEKGIKIFQTSSPSYIIMAGVDKGLDITKKSADLFSEMKKRIIRFEKNLKNLKNLTLYKKKTKELSKIVIISNKKTYKGTDLLQDLRNEYKLELEMAVGQYALAMTSFLDSQEGFDRLEQALREIDGKLDDYEDISEDEKKGYMTLPAKAMEIGDASNKPMEKIRLSEAGGRICGTEICIYPPGIPQLVPGERISDDIIKQILEMKESGLEVEGLSDDRYIEAVVE